MQHLKPFYILWSTFTYIIFLFFNKMSLKYFVWLGQVLAVACMMQFSSHGSNSGSLHWKRGISTTGLQGKSHINFSYHPCSCCYCWVTKSCLTLRPHGLQHTRLSCLSLSPRVCSNTCSLSRWHYPTISSSVAPFSSCLPSFPASLLTPCNTGNCWSPEMVGSLHKVTAKKREEDLNTGTSGSSALALTHHHAGHIPSPKWWQSLFAAFLPCAHPALAGILLLVGTHYFPGKVTPQWTWNWPQCIYP